MFKNNHEYSTILMIIFKNRSIYDWRTIFKNLVSEADYFCLGELLLFCARYFNSILSFVIFIY